jgi:hypothetical protein
MKMIIQSFVQLVTRSSRHTIIGIVCVSLIACTSVPSQDHSIPASVFDGLHREGIKPPIGETSDFKQQTKGKVAALTTLATIGAVLGGGQLHVGQRNQKPEAGYTVTNGHNTVFNDGESLAYADASNAMTEALRRKLINADISIADQSHYTILSVEKFWGIDYEKMTEKDNYRLYFNIETSLLDDKKVIHSFSCVGASDDKGSYAYWMDEDKKNVKLHAAVIGDICADRALMAFGLTPSTKIN